MSDEQPSRRYSALLLGIVLVGILGRLAHLSVALGSDDQMYIIGARELGQVPGSLPSPVYYWRIVFRLVLAAWGAVFGLSLESSAVLMLLLSSLSTVLVARITKRAFGPGASLLAAAIHATYPVNILYDVLTLPDSLAVPLVLASTLAFVRFLQGARWWNLALACWLAGLLFGVKEYFPLLILPYVACLISMPGRGSHKAGLLALASACFLVGLAVDPLAHFFDSGDPWRRFRIFVEYPNWPAQFASGPLQSRLAVRASYVQWLLTDYASAAGFLLLFGAVFLAFRFRRHAEARLLLLIAAVYFLFLSAAPCRLRPLVFVETQVRYSVIFLPFLAMGAGAACHATFAAVKDTVLRRCLATVLVVLCCVNLWTPGFNLPGYCRSECMAIRQVLAHQAEYGFSDLVLPRFFQFTLPDSYARYGVPLRFAGKWMDLRWDPAELNRLLEAHPRLAVFVPAAFVSVTQSSSAAGTAAEDARDTLRRLGFQPREIRVPGSSPGVWVDRLGFPTKGVAVGWLYVRPEGVTR